MRVVPIFASMLMLAAGSALAQAPAEKQPEGNIPLAQGPCSVGYENSVESGRIAGLSGETMREVDKNGDGTISRAEFNDACANKLFKEEDTRG
jgi:EF hand